MIEVRRLVKAFGLRPVLRGLDLSIQAGECVALIGPNGAGKTTLLRILAALSRPTGGSVTVGGWALPRQAVAVRGLIGYVAHQPLLYGDLTAEENLCFYARLYALDASAREARIDEVLRLVGLERRRHDLLRSFSRGMQQALAMARAILHDPPILLLDEPYTGLDQRATAALDGILSEVMARGRTVLMSTHDLSRGLALSGRVAILSQGKIACEAPNQGLDAAALTALYADFA